MRPSMISRIIRTELLLSGEAKLRRITITGFNTNEGSNTRSTLDRVFVRSACRLLVQQYI